MSKVMTHFIRSIDRTRILGTLAVKRIESNRLAFALAIANPDDPSPSRKSGREYAATRLEVVLSDWKAGNKFLSREDGIGHGIIGGICEVHEIIETLTKVVLSNVTSAIPDWLLRRDPNNINFIWTYLELFAKIRNDVEKAGQ